MEGTDSGSRREIGRRYAHSYRIGVNLPPVPTRRKQILHNGCHVGALHC